MSKGSVWDTPEGRAAWDEIGAGHVRVIANEVWEQGMDRSLAPDEIAIRRDVSGRWRAHYPNGGFSDAHVEAKKAIGEGYIHATQLLGWQVVAWKVLGLDEWRMVRRDDQKKSADDG